MRCRGRYNLQKAAFSDSRAMHLCLKPGGGKNLACLSWSETYLQGSDPGYDWGFCEIISNNRYI